MTGFVLRSAASLVLLAGMAALAAGLAAFGVLSTTSSARPIAVIIFQIATVFALGGMAALFIARTRRPMFPNERVMSPGAEPKVGGWLVVLALALVALPVWMMIRLGPFLAAWRQVVNMGIESNIWETGASNIGGLVLAPIFAALTPPFLELVTMFGFILASTTLLALLSRASQRFPRFYLAWMVLLSALVIGCVQGAAASSIAGAVVERALERSSRDAAEAAEVMKFVAPYVTTVNAAASILVWTLCGYLVWLPALFFSGRVRTTFQR